MKNKIRPKTLQIEPKLHAKMRVHVARLGIRIKVWVDRTIANAIKENK